MTQLGFVYKLCCIDPEIKEIYVGSTKNLRVRKNQHKHYCNNENEKKYNFNVYQFIRANGGFNNWSIIQLERVEFNTKYELHARERYYIELLKAGLNKFIPTRTYKEYSEENKEHIKERQKSYREQNKENIQESSKTYFKENKEKCIEYAKKYYDDNKEIINDKKKLYREKNKEKIKEYNKKYHERNKDNKTKI